MPRDPLLALSRLRGIALDSARRELADRLRRQAEEDARATAIAAELAKERAAWAGQQTVLGMNSYAAWLRRMSAAQQQVAAAQQAAGTASDEARAAVNLARADARVLEAALAHAQEARDGAAARQEQAAVDEAAALCKQEQYR